MCLDAKFSFLEHIVDIFTDARSMRCSAVHKASLDEVSKQYYMCVVVNSGILHKILKCLNATGK